ncbi:MAG: hypothetical protein AMXMBFR64_24040 [Myxococcales bacterium]
MARSQLVGALGVLLMLPGVPATAVPTSVLVQGVLRSEAGAPVSGSFASVVRIFDQANGGAPLYEQPATLQADGGVFDVTLGPLPLAAVDGAERWLEVTVGGQPPLPRQPLLAVPYAILADRATLASGVQCSGCVGGSAIGAGAVDASHIKAAAVGADAVSFPYAGSATKGGAAADLACSGCVGAGEVSFGYAASATPGGPATGLACSGCVGPAALAAAVDDRYVNATGDSMTGALHVATPGPYSGPQLRVGPESGHAHLTVDRPAADVEARLTFRTATTTLWQQFVDDGTSGGCDQTSLRWRPGGWSGGDCAPAMRLTAGGDLTVAGGLATASLAVSGASSLSGPVTVSPPGAWAGPQVRVSPIASHAWLDVNRPAADQEAGVSLSTGGSASWYTFVDNASTGGCDTTSLRWRPGSWSGGDCAPAMKLSTGGDLTVAGKVGAGGDVTIAGSLIGDRTVTVTTGGTSLPAGVRAYLPLDGSLVDVSGTTDVTGSQVTFTPAKRNNGAQLSGGTTTQWIRLAPSVFTGNTFSIAMWIRPTSSGRYVVSRSGSAGDNAITLGLSEVLIQQSGVSIPSPPLNQWTHYAVTYNGSIARIYFNGSEVATYTVSVSSFAFTSDLWLGQEQDCANGCLDAGQAYSGLMDEVVVYARALSPAEVQTVRDVTAAVGSGSTSSDIQALDIPTAVRIGGDVVGAKPVPLTQTTPLPTSGIVAHVPFEGSATDVSGKGTSVVGTSLSYTSGYKGQAASFPGGNTTSAVRVATGALPGSTFTVAFWLRPTANGKYVLSRTDGSNDNGLLIGVAGDVCAKTSCPALSALPLNTWTHVAVTSDGSTAHFYTNGATWGTTSISGSFSWTSDLWIGQEQDCANGCLDASQAYAGLVDELVVYDRALSPAEIATVISVGGGVQESTTVDVLNVITPVNAAAYYVGGACPGGALCDVAERFLVGDGVVLPGDVVAVDELRDASVRLSRRPYESSVMGVVSGAPGLLLGREVGGVAVALGGRVPVKVTGEGGPIRRGDLLTTSSTAGHAMRAAEAWRGGVIGTALQPFDGEVGQVLMLVALQPAGGGASLEALMERIEAQEARIRALER